MAIIAPLDLQKVFVIILAGTPEIFTFIAVILISVGAGYYKMNNFHALLMFALFGILMSSYIGGIYVLIILIAGMATFQMMSRFAK